ncbi:MAG TPA: hypothetical protein VME63_18270 [Dyella sp.]|uniref:hypothetical protein n=1 Tax=Dyella sp. TaxID=1869338 RepID=UPI002CC48D59|nr:hypothetical protein [Dyella sp.]HTV87347.1 hypothetical protein [Dyella sp.]
MAVIHGLAKFAEWFAPHRDKYVLIGGCAARTIMDEAGLEFRATRDLDVVLVVEAIDAAFARELWRFVEEGRYELRMHSGEGRPCFYRFDHPKDPAFPVMIELFARKPDLLAPLEHDNRLTPIPIEEDVSSLSAILLDDDAYHFLMAGRIEIEGLPLINEERLIPLKAQAWMDLSDRRADGEIIDSKKVRKHLKDVVKLSALLRADQVVTMPASIAASMQRFIHRARALPDEELAAFDSRAAFTLAIDRVAGAFASSAMVVAD